MTADLLVGSVVPLVVILVMLAVGLNLDLSALRDSLVRPRSLLLCTLFQIVLLPGAALAMIAVLSPPPLVAVLMFAVAISPGGNLSNVITHLARGNLALSVVMTVATTLLVSATAPMVAGVASWAGAHEVAAWNLSPASVARDLVLVALLPISLGAVLGAVLPGLVARLRRGVDVLCALAILTLLVCSAIVSWPVLRLAATDYLVPAAALSLTFLVAGLAVAAMLPIRDRSACVIEFGMRNLPIAIVLAAGAGPSAEIVAFLLCHFVVNAALLFALALALSLARRGRGLRRIA